MRLFSFRRPARVALSVRPVRARLSLEYLENRETPTELPPGMGLTPPPRTPPPYETPANVRPVIEDFWVAGAGPGTYQISGKVIDENPGGLTVTFGGGVTGIDGMTATTDSEGNFVLTVTIGPGNIGGVVTADVTDSGGLAAVQVNDTIP